MPLRRKFLLLLLSLSLLPMVVVGTLAYRQGVSAIEENLGRSFQDSAHEAIGQVDRTLSEVFVNTESWAALDVMQEVLSGDVDGRITSFLISMKEQYGSYAGLAVVDSPGEVVASSEPSFIGQNWGSRDVVRAALQGRAAYQDQPDPETGAWVVTFAQPIRERFAEGHVAGALVAKWRIGELSEMLKRVPGDSAAATGERVMLTRHDGLVISAPRSGSQDVFRQNLVKDGRESARLATRGGEGYLVEMDQSGRKVVVGYAGSRGYRAFSGLGWAALVLEDAKAAFAPIDRLKLAFVGVGLGVALVVTLVSLLIARQITEPVQKISEVAGRVSRGDLDGQVEHASADEIGYLIRVFNEMILQLKKQRGQLLEEHNYVESILASMLDGLLVVDRHGTIRTVNRAATLVLGYSEAELMGTSAGGLFAEGEAVFNGILYSALLERGPLEGGDLTYVTKTGRTVPVTLSASVLRDTGGGVDAIVCVVKDITERKKLEMELRHQALHDPLTGLANRVLLLDRLEHALERQVRQARQVGVLFLDLDNFKIVNDSLGHAAGDELLTAVARRLVMSVRPTDTVARLGGDEFGVLLEDLTMDQEAVDVTERILVALRAPFDLLAGQVPIQASLGVVVSAAGEESGPELLRNADIAMYAAKARGKGRREVFEPGMLSVLLELANLERDLCQALEREEFILHYQPVVRLETGEIMGFEALLRWRHPLRGLLGPLEFIPLAEEKGLIVPIGRWVLQTACRQARLWQERYPSGRPRTLSVNISARQLQHPGLYDDVVRALEDSSLAPECLILEITESVMMHDLASMKDILDVFRGLGVHVAIDDFGTGYSSLSYLRQLSVDILKVDKSFVDQIEGQSEGTAVIEAVLSLAETLGMKAIVEGLETEQQVAQMCRLGGRFGQGYYFARPLEAGAVEARLHASRFAEAIPSSSA